MLRSFTSTTPFVCVFFLVFASPISRGTRAPYRWIVRCAIHFPFWHFSLGCTIFPLISRNPPVDRSISFAFAWGTPINQSCHKWDFALFTLCLMSLDALYLRAKLKYPGKLPHNYDYVQRISFWKKKKKKKKKEKRKEKKINNVQWIYVTRNIKIMRNNMLHNVNINN